MVAGANGCDREADPLAMIRETIAQLVQQAAHAAMKSGALPSAPLPDVAIDRPRQPEHGDYATNFAMVFGRQYRTNPLTVAEAIRDHFPATAMLASFEVARPGFINFRLDDRWLTEQVETVLQAGDAFGSTTLGQGARVNVEFVSANPTGPLTVGNGRGAVYGSTLTAVLNATGHEAASEYYINDAGNQIETFARTLYARYQQLFGRTVMIPEDGYPGEYVIEVAKTIRAEHGDSLLRPEGEPGPAEIGRLGIETMIAQIRADLASLRVEFDVWFSERSLYEQGQYEQIMATLQAAGALTEREGATWLSAAEGSDDKDNVIVRSSGAPTYFASDIAYHYSKLVERGFDRAIDIWGADHHGHVARLKSAIGALGLDPERLIVLLYQLVTVRRGGEVVRLSKRAGEIIMLRDLMEEVGTDACRFFFLQRSADSTLDFDIDLAKSQSDKNPVYYVQYSHARIAGILRTGTERGLSAEGGDVALLTEPAELALIRKMLQLPEVLDQIATKLEPHHLPYYAIELATVFNAFYRDVRVVTEDEARSRARLKLVAAAKVAFGRTLGLMGMTAPDRMERAEAEAEA